MNTTLVTCYYKLKSKFNEEVYRKWMSELLNNVNNFNLVIYTNEESKQILETIIDKYNKKIKVLIKEYHEFNTWCYNDLWINNHEKNNTLNHNSFWDTDWKLNMLWSEKIHFVYEVKSKKIFETEWYGWCDIGYFRGGNNLNSTQIREWPNKEKISVLNKFKIYYGLPGDRKIFNQYVRMLLDKNDIGIPKKLLPVNQISIAGGFFLCHHDNIEWWNKTYYTRLYEYFSNRILIKDDQYIIVDCISNNLKKFCIIEETQPNKDKWFVFQNFLL